MDDYKKIFNHIEMEVIDLSYSISFKKGQECVYSPRIANLIIRLGSLLESIIKEQCGETDIKYDADDVINYLGIANKTVIVSNPEYKFSQKKFTPFQKNQEKLNKKNTNKHAVGQTQYSWNNAYQSLKHQFLQMMPEYGNLRYLFEILSVLAVLLTESSVIFSNVKENEDGNYIGWSYSASGGVSIRKSYNKNEEIN
ncbi:hypothetical protein Q2K23_13300 [Enterococcus faecium]|uniref:hypothetical protein n=1 Tax=Enterococcus faecium TaxID=1352 RepID=UPI00265F802C|nr:hypothetical protein [Enterococcus faecium]MDO1601096.1 hypothetical protein [Enterococcus faecium]